MILMEKYNTLAKGNTLERIYINTLIPYFKFKNRKGNVIAPRNCCIAL